MSTITRKRGMRVDRDTLWEILSDIENEQRYWTNLRDIRILRREGNTVEREATVGPKAFAQRSHQKVTLNPKSSIRLTMSSEALGGERLVELMPDEVGTVVSVTWSLRTKSLPSFVLGLVSNQIAKATDEALSRIAKEAEARLAEPRASR